MKRLAILLASALLVVVLGGCSASYFGRNAGPMRHDTLIKFKENDFKVTETHLTGTASCAYLLGMPLGDPRVLSLAQQEMTQAASSSILGRPVQMINWTLDQVWTNYFLIYRNHKVVLSADLIEYDAQ